MRIIVRAEGVRLRLPVPLFLASAAVRLLPESAITEMKKSLPEPYRKYITKKLLRDIVRECRYQLKQYKGLEVVHVEAKDGTFVSIRL